jgi:hypothetical protein
LWPEGRHDHFGRAEQVKAVVQSADGELPGPRDAMAEDG